MSWLISKKPEGDEENKKTHHNVEANVIVSSHLQLKGDPNNKTGTLDKEVVLRRIRQRKRVNKFRSLVGSFFPSTKSTSAATSEQDHEKDDSENHIASPVQVLGTAKWVDNPFVDP